MQTKIRVKYCNIRPQQAYTGRIKRYILYFDKRPPPDMGASQVGQNKRQRFWRFKFAGNAVAYPFLPGLFL